MRHIGKESRLGAVCTLGFIFCRSDLLVLTPYNSTGHKPPYKQTHQKCYKNHCHYPDYKKFGKARFFDEIESLILQYLSLITVNDLDMKCVITVIKSRVLKRRQFASLYGYSFIITSLQKYPYHRIRRCVIKNSRCYLCSSEPGRNSIHTHLIGKDRSIVERHGAYVQFDIRRALVKIIYIDFADTIPSGYVQITVFINGTV